MKSTCRLVCVLFFLLLVLLSLASVALVGNTLERTPSTRVIGILSSMTLEMETVGQELTDKTETIIQGVRFTTGNLKGRKVVLTHSGMGKVKQPWQLPCLSSSSSRPTSSSPGSQDASIQTSGPATS